ncbi:hypothetical protein [Acidianus manzaensis]|uniref:Uncharacterized protein n=1 Tax=Acidianus manzaensis TaxID=282676 RepID=A0A1W6K2P9_9CREN|nr:hypothetical protein [Acidianus manzaensis]ARM76813.1 hypothetical protein B6F84_12820 [Acidianus manzaensis]
MFKLLYFRSTYTEIPLSISIFVQYDAKIEKMLQTVKEKCGIEVESRDLSIEVEKSFYTNYLENNYLLQDNLQILFENGINVSIKNPRDKFKSGKNKDLSFSLFVFYGEKVIVGLKGNPVFQNDEVTQFLERLSNNCSFLNLLQITEGKKKAPRSESEIIREFASMLKSKGYSCFKNVKEIPRFKSIIAFPDIDLIAVKGEEVLCFEAKSSSETKNLYTALGEAMYYLINEIENQGGFCDKVYILLPDEPKDSRAYLISKLTPIGIILINGKVILEANQNPYLNLSVKKKFLSSLQEMRNKI